VATRIIAMVPQNIRRYAGGYDYYHEKMQEEFNATTVTVSKNKEAIPSVNSRKALRQERALQRQELYNLTKDLKKKITQQEKKIEALENQQHLLASALQDAANAKIGLDFESLGKRLKLVQHELDEATRQWEKDSTELEAITKQPDD
jgi:ATPase subunit of ABC transporter with duplicated ATPase domains